MAEHTVKAYDLELQELASRISEMGGVAEVMVAGSVDALIRADTKSADQIIATDSRLDTLEREIDDRAILTIARRQPMADDLRFIVSSIKLASDIERIGDLAKNISKRAKVIGQPFIHQSLANGVTHLGELVLDRLHTVLDAYSQRDVEAAMDVWRRDEEIDALHNSIFRELLTYMMEDPRNIGFCTHLLFCAKNLERMGDHCTNIAETIHYLSTGRPLLLERPRTGAVTSGQDLAD